MLAAQRWLTIVYIDFPRQGLVRSSQRRGATFSSRPTSAAMGEMGRFVVAAITSTIYGQLDPSWQNADQGGPVTVTIARAPTVPAAAHLPPAPTPASLTRIEDGPEVEGRTMPLPSPFPGPVIPGLLPGSAIHEPPSLTSSSAAQRGAVESEETRHQDGPPGETYESLVREERFWVRPS